MFYMAIGCRVSEYFVYTGEATGFVSPKAHDSSTRIDAYDVYVIIGVRYIPYTPCTYTLDVKII